MVVFVAPNLAFWEEGNGDLGPDIFVLHADWPGLKIRIDEN